MPSSAFFPITSLNIPVDPALIHSGEGHLEVIDLLPDLSTDIEAEFSDRESAMKARAFVCSLPKELKEIARRYYWLDETQYKIAKDLGVTQQAVSYSMAKICRLGREYFHQSVQ